MLKLILSLTLLMVGTCQAYACDCVAYPGKSAEEVAAIEMNDATVVFEGTVVRTEPSDLMAALNSRGPIIVTFAVSKWLKGEGGSSVKISSSLGGGDCGMGQEFVIATGLKYLLYARTPAGFRAGEAQYAVSVLAAPMQLMKKR